MRIKILLLLVIIRHWMLKINDYSELKRKSMRSRENYLFVRGMTWIEQCSFFIKGRVSIDLLHQLVEKFMCNTMFSDFFENFIHSILASRSLDGQSVRR